MKQVTRWTHPSFSQALILEGGSEETLTEAMTYVSKEDDIALLRGRPETMTDKDFASLREFEG